MTYRNVGRQFWEAQSEHVKGMWVALRLVRWYGTEDVFSWSDINIKRKERDT